MAQLGGIPNLGSKLRLPLVLRHFLWLVGNLARRLITAAAHNLKPPQMPNKIKFIKSSKESMSSIFITIIILFIKAVGIK